MRFKPTTSPSPAVSRPSSRRTLAAFTLAESLAALAFMAIVIPVAVEGIRVANLAGQVADRKATATRVADRLLSEVVVTKQWQNAGSGSGSEGSLQYRWKLQTDNWSEQSMKQLSVHVYYDVQGKEYDVRLTTLVDTSTQ